MGFLGVESLSPAYAKTCTENGTPHIYIRSRAGFPWEAWPAVLKWLNEARPEAIIIHSITALLPCWWYARRHQIPLLSVEHTSNALKTKGEWISSHLAMMLSHVVVLLTDQYGAELQDRLGVFYRKKKVKIIPNGIDTNRFSPLSGDGDNATKTFRMGMASRFTEKKRQDSLVNMIEIIRENNPDIDCKLSLAGDGATLKRIRNQVADKHLDNFVSFPGHLGEDDLLSWFQSLDLYLHASDGETLSTSLLQAMSMGLPIIASDVPGISNLLKTGLDYGLLVKDSEPAGFSKLVLNLLDNPELAKELSLVARLRAVEIYSQDSMFKFYNKIVQEIIP